MQLFSTEIPEIDADHLRLEEMVRRIEDACRQSLPDKQIRKLLSDLASEIQSHFVREQEDMMAREYSSVAIHADEHDHLVRALEAIERLYASGDICLDRSLVGFLWSWLVDHIRTADKAYADFLLQRAEPTDSSSGRAADEPG